MASKYEQALADLLTVAGVPPAVRQFCYAKPLRQYKADFAWPEAGLLVEVDGGAFIGRGGSGSVISRTTPTGYHQTIEDYRKRNLAQLLGYTLLSYQPGQFTEAVAEIQMWIGEARFGGRVHGAPGLADSVLEQHVAGLAEDDKVRRTNRQARTKRRRRIVIGGWHKGHPR